jgi:hypothetical protein
MYFWITDEDEIDSINESDDERQLKNLSDGQGGVFVDGELMTEQEAKDIQARGELYDNHLR